MSPVRRNPSARHLTMLISASQDISTAIIVMGAFTPNVLQTHAKNARRSRTSQRPSRRCFPAWYRNVAVILTSCDCCASLSWSMDDRRRQVVPGHTRKRYRSRRSSGYGLEGSHGGWSKLHNLMADLCMQRCCP